ncbi:MAG: hypothetical protein V3R66_06200, partial [Rhodospirillales bacterium]
MIGRTLKGVVHILAGLGAGLAIILVLLAWRLSSGPISLAFLSPYIEDALDGMGGGAGILLDDTILTWGGWDRTLDVRVINVRLLGPDKAAVASIPEVAVSISLKALVRGIVVPKSIDLIGPRLWLKRRSDGGLEAGLGGDTQPSAGLFKRLAGELMAAPDPARAMSYLERINIIDANLTIVDRALEKFWRAPSAQANLRRVAGGIRGELSFDLEMKDANPHFTVIGTYLAGKERLDLGIEFTKVRPA